MVGGVHPFDLPGEAAKAKHSIASLCLQKKRTEGISQVEDFIVDDETWAVRYLVIDTSNWWFGKKVLVAPQWATRVSWAEHKVYVDMTRQGIKDSPEWDPSAAINREYEASL